MHSPIDIFANAGLFQKAIMILMVAATLAAVAICARKLAAGSKLAGGSAFLSSLRLGGPILGCLGATYGLVNIFIGIANVTAPITLKLVAPGLAEAVFIASLGFLAGAVATAAHWAVEARIDREVLKP